MNLGDWRGFALPANDKRQKESVIFFNFLRRCRTNCAKLKEKLVDLQTAGDEEGSEDNSSTVFKRRREPDASPIEFHRTTLAGGTVWDSPINLKKIIELLVQRNEVSGIQVVGHLWIFFCRIDAEQGK